MRVLIVGGVQPPCSIPFVVDSSDWVEQRFNRARYSADLTVNQLTDRLRDVTDVLGVKERPMGHGGHRPAGSHVDLGPQN